MFRRAVLLWIGLSVCGVAAAQRLAPLPPAAVEPSGRLVQDYRVRYLLRQLELTPKQAEEARGLLEVHYSRVARPSLSGDDVDRLRALMQAFEEAKARGDKDEMERVQAEIRLIGQNLDPEPEFWENLDPILTEPQKKALKDARERLKVNPTGAIRSEDILAILEKLDLRDEQKAKLADLRTQYTQSVAKASGERAAAERLEALNRLMTRAADLLTPEQLRTYRGTIRMMRPDLADRRLGRPDAGGERRGGRDAGEGDEDDEDAGEDEAPPASRPAVDEP